MRDQIDTDVCIVGGGPAGLTLALLLLRSGVAVTVVERSNSTAREYRGEILQPGGAAVLDALGALDGVLRRGAHRLSGFRVLEGAKVLIDIDYGRLPAPYDHLVAVPQPHILEELSELCGEHPQFRLLSGHRLSRLLGERAVTGVVATAGSRAVTVHARVVVGADGRFSKTRRLAGIDGGRLDVFDQDVLWFKLHAPDHLTGRVQVFRSTGSAAIVHDSFPEHLQIGWALPHGGYPAIAERGLAYVKDQLCRTLPQYATLVHDQINHLSELTLLDVFAGCAERWADDGLVLIGDAAHTHGPLGAQGINLALQDAVALHPILLDALADGRAVGTEALAPFERLRRPDVDAVLKMQRMQSRGMFERKRTADLLRPVLAGLIRKTPIGTKLTRRIAFGNPAIRTRTDLFSQP